LFFRWLKSSLMMAMSARASEPMSLADDMAGFAGDVMVGDDVAVLADYRAAAGGRLLLDAPALGIVGKHKDADQCGEHAVNGLVQHRILGGRSGRETGVEAGERDGSCHGQRQQPGECPRMVRSHIFI
jgi:hypothetical protein